MQEKNFLYKVCKIIYKPLLFILYRPKVYGRENIPSSGKLIFAGNHKHAVDPTVVMSNTDRIVHFMAKEELFKGLHGIIFNKMGLIKVHKDRNKNAVSVNIAENILNNNGTLGIFPEGTRNKNDNELLKFRYGTVRIAKKTNSLIIPFAIRGKYKLLKKGLEIEFGKPIDVKKLDIEQANSYLKDEVLRLLKNERFKR